MLIRFHTFLKTPCVQSACLQCILALLLILLMPLSIDGLDHDSFAVESALTHDASPIDFTPIESATKMKAAVPVLVSPSDKSYRLPTSQFLITRTTTSFL